MNTLNTNFSKTLKKKEKKRIQNALDFQRTNKLVRR